MLTYDEFKEAMDNGFIKGDTVQIVRKNGKIHDYVSKLCSDPDLLEQFNEQLKRAVPFKRNTKQYFTAISSSYYGERIDINTFSGITISDPSTNPGASKKNETAWYIATH